MYPTKKQYAVPRDGIKGILGSNILTEQLGRDEAECRAFWHCSKGEARTS